MRPLLADGVPPAADATPAIAAGAQSTGAADGCFECDVCGQQVAGQPETRGLLVWTRGDEVRYEEPPVCAECSERLGLCALAWLSDGLDEE